MQFATLLLRFSLLLFLLLLVGWRFRNFSMHSSFDSVPFNSILFYYTNFPYCVYWSLHQCSYLLSAYNVQSIILIALCVRVCVCTRLLCAVSYSLYELKMTNAFAKFSKTILPRLMLNSTWGIVYCCNLAIFLSTIELHFFSACSSSLLLLPFLRSIFLSCCTSFVALFVVCAPNIPISEEKSMNCVCENFGIRWKICKV